MKLESSTRPLNPSFAPRRAARAARTACATEPADAAMATTRRFRCTDLLKFNDINLDVLTETYNQSFYLNYFARWPQYFLMQEAPSGNLMGYIMGKAEGKGENGTDGRNGTDGAAAPAPEPSPAPSPAAP